MDPDNRLQITLECIQLSHAFARFVDAGEAHRVAGLFAADAVFTRKGESLRGREQILAALLKRGPNVVTRHLCSTTHVEVHSAHEARGVTYFELHRHERQAGEANDAPAPLTMAETVGEYHDDFALTPEGWRIRARSARGIFRRAA